MSLKLRHLEVFDALVQAGSITRAAARLNLTQPAVSIALAQLEKDVGFRLFHRSRGYFAPTGEALMLHAEVEGSLLALARVAGRAREIREGSYGAISIASNGAAAINLLPFIIAGFQAEHPAVQIDLHVRSSRQVASLVGGGQIDIGLLDAPVPVPGLESEVFAFSCICILREDDPLAAEPVLTPRLLAGRQVIAITGDHSIDRQVAQAFSLAGVALRRQVSSAFFAIARNLVRAGSGVALVDPVNGRADIADGVTWRPFRPTLHFELALVTAADTPLAAPARAFLSKLRLALRRQEG